MNQFIPYLIVLIFLSSCQTDSQSDKPFKPVVTDFNNKTVLLPAGFKYEVLFSEGDSVVAPNGSLAPAKGSHDMVIYVPIKESSQHGYLYVSHESHKPNAVLGDGGGGSIMEVKHVNGKWGVIGTPYSVDFSNVGETFRNCGGTLTPHGNIITAEEEWPQSNTEIYSRFGITDTSDFNGRKKYLNYGWMVEVDPITKKAIRKLTSMGRYPHEDAHCMPDGKTVYLTSDHRPAVFFKFVADKPGDYTAGQLYAYRQSEDGKGGSWITLPMQVDSLDNITDVAVRLGASMFVSHEWVEAVGNKLYITESGSSKFSFERELAMGGKAAIHLDACCRTESGKYSDPYGRILEFDMNTLKMSVLLHGGVSANDSLLSFSSPDAMTSVQLNGKTYLVISEDSHSGMNGKATPQVRERNETYNEIYFLDLGIHNPTLDDLQRFMMAPEGCETTGNFFTPDNKTHFLSIQHPSTTNPAPFNKSCVIAITGYK